MHFFLEKPRAKDHIPIVVIGTTGKGKRTMAKGKHEEMTRENGETGSGQHTPNGEDQSPVGDEAIGERMWQTLMTPDTSAPDFASRWAHLTQYYIGAYGEYRVIKHVPDVITLRGKDAVAYALSEIPSPAQEGEPVSFYDAIAKAAKGKPHNARRNFGAELFDTMVENFIAKYDPNPDSATRGERKAKFDAWSKAFRETESTDPNIVKVDRFLVNEATALRDSEDMRRKVKTRTKADKPEVDEPQTPRVTSADLTSRLANL